MKIEKVNATDGNRPLTDADVSASPLALADTRTAASDKLILRNYIITLNAEKAKETVQIFAYFKKNADICSQKYGRDDT